MQYILICCVLCSVCNVALAAEMGDFSEQGECYQYENDQEGGERDDEEVDGKRRSSEILFFKTLQEICMPKVEDVDKARLISNINYALNDRHELLECVNESFESPLLFALKNKNLFLLTSIVIAEKRFFNKCAKSLQRRRELLDDAVKTYYIEGIKVLMLHGASPGIFSENDNILSHLIINCTANRLTPTCFTCCFKPKIDPQREQLSYIIAKILIDKGAPVHHLKGALNQYNCRGVGCSHMRQCANTPVQINRK